MLTVESKREPSIKRALYLHYPTGKRIRELYGKWDRACLDKNYHECEHIEFEIRRLHRRLKIEET